MSSPSKAFFLSGFLETETGVDRYLISLARNSTLNSGNGFFDFFLLLHYLYNFIVFIVAALAHSSWMEL